MKSFKERVLGIVRKVPKGKTLSYKEVAKRAGHTLAARAVGAIMRANHDPNVPCHRVIKSDGTFGSYNRGGTKAKLKILKREGILR